MGKHRKKPVVIEAVQFQPGENDEEMMLFLDGCSLSAHGGIIIPTLKGDHFVQPGDWIIKDVKGEFSPCKPDIFEATYEQVEDQ